MHIATITTITPDGQALNVDTIITAGTDTDALHQAAELARNVSIDLHAADPWQPHAHLIALGDEPHAVLTPRTTTDGRTDLLASLKATHHITP